MAVVGDRVGGLVHLGEQGKYRRLTFSQKGEHEPQIIAYRIAFDTHFVLEAFVLCGLLDAGSLAIELPAVIEAADAVIFNPAEI